MTPAANWSPDDYYRASRSARAAWERQDHQLSILSDSPALAMLGLDTDEAKRAASYRADGPAAAASSVSSPPIDTSLSGGAGSLPPEERSL